MQSWVSVMDGFIDDVGKVSESDTITYTHAYIHTCIRSDTNIHARRYTHIIQTYILTYIHTHMYIRSD